jgi:hypothetical protein
MTGAEQQRIKIKLQHERAYRDELISELAHLRPASQRAINLRQSLADAETTIRQLEQLLG